MHLSWNKDLYHAKSSTVKEKATALGFSYLRVGEVREGGKREGEKLLILCNKEQR